MLQLARSHMGVREDARLRLYCQDGLQFMHNAVPQAYDVVIVDVAAPDQVRDAPTHTFHLLQKILTEIQGRWERLRMLP